MGDDPNETSKPGALVIVLALAAATAALGPAWAQQRGTNGSKEDTATTRSTQPGGDGAKAGEDAGVLADFDGDGSSDLAVGTPGEDAFGGTDVGTVTVLFGSPDGLGGAGNQLIAQSNPESGDHFGLAVATGDFNGDGSSDLAVGAPDEDVGASGRAGAVTVYAGTPSGRASNKVTFTQGAGGVGGAAESGDFFGAALASS